MPEHRLPRRAMLTSIRDGWKKMAVGGSRQETLDPGFVLFGTRQQGVSVILRELADSITCHPASQSETLPLSYPGRD
ncbi:unnamed protein product [Schistosoma mattheei]|uniref:Uncharacterized protein n=1 Tax=Schistosoma mattheei TaxID=31246 RepID=A0A183P595_9TREM|nr:unnamed protein product [Schistosoma mattheei]